jgi:hypothetical protein
LIDGEKMRVTTERNLPSSASDLVRGIVETWQPTSDEATKTSRDQWLTRRLGEIEESLVKMPMPREEQYDLEDALDPLEKDLAGYTQATQTLAHLRVALGAQTPSSPAPWDSIAKELAPHVGAVAAPEALIARFETLEKSLHPTSQPEDAAQLAIKKMLIEGDAPCALEGHGSLVRSLGAPAERDMACRIVHAVASSDPNARLAMHRVVALAIAAIGLHTGKKHEPHPAMLQGIPLLGVRAAGHPAPVIVAALAIEDLLASLDPAARARAWLAFGDAPLDVIARELR